MTAELDDLRDRIARYLAGTLPPAEAQRLEQQFAADPTLAERLGLGVRLGRIYRLLDADRPAEPALPRWQERRVVLAGAAGLALSLVALAVVAWRWDVTADRLAYAEARAARGLLDAASATQSVVLDPEGRGGTLAVPAAATRVDLRVRVRNDRYPAYRATLEARDGATLFVAERLRRDTNGQVGLAFNSSIVPEGEYQVRIDGVTWRGERQPLARAAFRLVKPE